MRATLVGLGILALVGGGVVSRGAAQQDADPAPPPTSTAPEEVDEAEPDADRADALASPASETSTPVVSAAEVVAEVPVSAPSDVTGPATAAPSAAAPAPEAPEADEPAATPDAPRRSFLDDLTLSAFADVYVAEHWTLPDGFAGNHADLLGHRAFDVMGGPALSFLGIDVSYAPRPIGATLAIRFGSSMPRLMGATSGLPDGLQFLKQAFVSWQPLPQLTFSLGLFDTPFGAEVSESWLNPTYTRGSLYNVLQPFYHTGLRAVWTPNEHVTLTALAVNGWNTFIDNNDGKSGGLQLTLTEGAVSASLGYLTGPEGTDNGRFRHFADGIVRVSGNVVQLVLNGDFIAEDVGGGSYDLAWGAMATLRTAMTSEWAAAFRGEYLGDPDTGTGLITATLTLEWLPDPLFVIRLDNRVDAANDARFHDNAGNASSYVVSTVLGLVVHSR